jgi:hypothetical protein
MGIEQHLYLFSLHVLVSPARSVRVCEQNEQQRAQRARVRALHALMRFIRGKKRMEFVNRDFNAAINSRRFAVLKTKPED